MTDWQPIATAPRDGTRLLLWPRSQRSRLQFACIGYWHQPGNPKEPGYWTAEMYGNANGATHWMPLPEPPDALA